MFKKILPLLLSAFIVHCGTGAGNETPVIPNPLKVQPGNGSFTLKSGAPIIVSSPSPELGEVAALFQELTRKDNGIELALKRSATPEKGSLILELKENAALGDEGYVLEIRPNVARISAPTATGVFYGLQTLRQLSPTGINGKLQLPCITITDQPRYGWRGLMLDESRHFMGMDRVKMLLDTMALYKMNRFHWHLTDSDGWRIEIKKYPKLTTIGGIGDRTNPQAPSQFYTQTQIKELVEYARRRQIQVIPEIDMPGHAAAATRAYPQHTGGGSKSHPDFTFNPGKEETYQFLEDILTEVSALFPSEWLHIGGDEVHFGWGQWPSLPEVQALQKEHNLKDLKEVEHYFIRRIARFITTDLGKTVTGWDEITGAGIEPGTSLLMWWRHDKPHLRDKALKGGYKTILCPRQPCYFDFVQNPTHRTGRKWDGAATLEKIIDFPTFPDTYTEKELGLVQGIQCNLWTERVVSKKRMEFMIYPRMLAIAESGWAAADRKSQDGFKQRLKAQLPRLDAYGIYYYNPFDPASTPEVHE